MGNQQAIYPLTQEVLCHHSYVEDDDKIVDEEEIKFLGEENITHLIQNKRAEAKGFSDAIKLISEQIDIIEKSDAGSMKKIAEKSENPTFTELGYISCGLSTKGLEPLDEASKKRKYGATTFNICGWCKFVKKNEARHYYAINGFCQFERNGGISGERYNFNTPCFLPTASNDTLKKILEGLLKAREELIKFKKTVDARIKNLFKFRHQTTSKPIFSDDRSDNYAKVGDKVVVYESSIFLKNPIFITGTVIRKEDMYCTLYLDKPVRFEHLFKKIYRYQVGCFHPYFFLANDFEYLLKNLEFAELWSKKATHNQHNHKKFMCDLIKESKFYYL